MTSATEKIAKILRTDKDFVAHIEARFSAVTGKQGVMEAIIAENEEKIRNSLLTIGVSRDAPAKEVYDALISKVESDDHKIFDALDCPKWYAQKGCEKVLAVAKQAAGVNHGFFLKKEKAVQLLMQEPPQNILKQLGYRTVDELLAKEDLFEVWSALRFIEGSEWLNGTFFKQYEALTPDDFEEREIVVRALSEKWKAAAESFVVKKKHNISHLKELGVVFIIPVALGISGELLRMLGLIFHYLHEIPFYSGVFQRIAKNRETFAQNLVALLRGDVLDERLPQGETSDWLVVQRYLAKEDDHEWRLFVPHINPEAVHWQKTSEDFVRLGEIANGFSGDVAFWRDLDWVGDYFKDDLGNPTLVSFNLVDTVMSLVKEKELVKYLYHHQEALWNKIFSAYFGFEKLEQYASDHLLEGKFEI